MKTEKLILSLFTLLLTLAAKAEIPQLSCTNIMYRESALSLDPNGEILVQDSVVGGVEAIVQRAVETRSYGAGVVSSVALAVPAKLSDCTTVGKAPLHCTSSATAAKLIIKGWIANGVSEATPLRIEVPVQMKNFELKGQLSAPGPIQLGSGSVTVSLNRLVVDASADIRDGDLEGKLEISSFFYMSGQGNGSSCH